MVCLLSIGAEIFLGPFAIKLCTHRLIYKYLVITDLGRNGTKISLLNMVIYKKLTNKVKWLTMFPVNN